MTRREHKDNRAKKEKKTVSTKVLLQRLINAFATPNPNPWFEPQDLMCNWLGTLGIPT